VANELDALDPVPEVVTLTTGTQVQIEDLKSRQFFKLLRIVTRGALPALRDFSVFQTDVDFDVKEFAGRFLSLMLLSIPEAEDEAIEFVNAMVKPVGLIERPRGSKLSKQDLERNTELWQRVIVDLDNPELDDLVTIIEAVVKREAADIQALGKRLAAMFRMAEKTGQVPGSPNRTSPDWNTSAGSRERSTSSVTSTDGPDSNVSTSASESYVNT